MSEVEITFSPALIESALDERLPCPVQGDDRYKLHEAMRYAVLGGGKRVRARLVVESARAVPAKDALSETIVSAACAVELVHAYSLVHDDLPAMDNSPVRRGRPSCHLVFGEAVAILAGDALLTLAFGLLAGDEPCDGGTSVRQQLLAVRALAEASGESGMVGGQAIDMEWSATASEQIEGATLLAMHGLKTGALLRCSAELGGIMGGGNVSQVSQLRRYGTCLGKAFQITDDILDRTGNPSETGKASTDEANGKVTAPAVFGLNRARAMAEEAISESLLALDSFGAAADNLRGLTLEVARRQK